MRLSSSPQHHQEQSGVQEISNRNRQHLQKVQSARALLIAILGLCGVGCQAPQQNQSLHNGEVRHADSRDPKPVIPTIRNRPDDLSSEEFAELDAIIRSGGQLSTAQQLAGELFIERRRDSLARMRAGMKIEREMLAVRELEVLKLLESPRNEADRFGYTLELERIRQRLHEIDRRMWMFMEPNLENDPFITGTQ